MMKRASLIIFVVLTATAIARARYQDGIPVEATWPEKMNEIQSLFERSQKKALSIMDGLEHTMTRVAQAKHLNRDEKAVIEREFDKVGDKFKEVLQPMLSAYDESAEKANIFKSEQETLQIKYNRHNSYHPNPENETAVKSYNQEAEQLAAQQRELNDRAGRQLGYLKAQLQQGARKADAWLSGPELRTFTTKTEGLLNKRLRFTKGLAWNQLVAASAGRHDEVFDGRRGTSGNPDAVDARGVRPMTATERKKAQAKPRAQMPERYRRKTTVPPPHQSPQRLIPGAVSPALGHGFGAE